MLSLLVAVVRYVSGKGSAKKKHNYEKGHDAEVKT